MISCLCVTRGDRPGLLANAVGDFTRQSFADRELVILHDGDATAHDAIAEIVAAHPAAEIRIERAEPGLRLGGLRNLAIARARGDWVCQWDDDDRHHPERLALQWNQAQADGAPVNYLVDQLHWFVADNLLFWDDWDREYYPMNLIQGTILARRDIMPPYPDLARGEDTLQTHAMLRAASEQGFRISRLRGAGWCYIYVCHGQNVWDLAHHRAISASKHLAPELLLPRLPKLRRELAAYSPAIPDLAMAVGDALEKLSIASV